MEKVNISQLPAGSPEDLRGKIGERSGYERYSIDGLLYDTVKFHAEIGGTRSATKKVALRAV